MKRVGIWVRVSSDMQVTADSPEVHLFRASRELRGLRIIDLSKLSGVPTKQISHIEHDRRVHYLPCAKIERALSIPVRYLFSRSQLRSPI